MIVKDMSEIKGVGFTGVFFEFDDFGLVDDFFLPLLVLQFEVHDDGILLHVLLRYNYLIFVATRLLLVVVFLG